MTVEQGPVDRADCWCCGGAYAEADLFRLSAHPEVAVCSGCAQFLARRAAARADEARPSWHGRLRSLVRRAREAVIARGWHRRPFVGRLLRAIDRELP